MDVQKMHHDKRWHDPMFVGIPSKAKGFFENTNLRQKLLIDAMQWSWPTGRERETARAAPADVNEHRELRITSRRYGCRQKR
ncbi:hypothetical protein M514_07440 [Trichuris suis]|uniref:Uncharacterized protein n=1 Tax=Trichuris suis TaxID=68888 RepID=A0A085NCD4_9BILA|nr:hypothetical protein M513_07440 [Trichuris suis]KFD67130.1 hypothetical protein M514_07440 [Trichuris suis]